MLVLSLVLFLVLGVISQAALRVVGGPAVPARECVRQGTWLREGRAPVVIERAKASYWDAGAIRL